ncbi:unnamed protein product [Rhizophagus irregularis]|nr:unnamed protein product [Rhizophagus irregularis]
MKFMIYSEQANLITHSRQFDLVYLKISEFLNSNSSLSQTLAIGLLFTLVLRNKQYDACLGLRCIVKCQQTISRNKGTEYDDIAASSSEYRRCTNRGSMFSSFGQLRRVDSVESDAQRTEFQPGEYHFVYVNSNYFQEQSTSKDHSSILQMSTRDSKDEVSSISNHPSILVKTFENVSGRSCFASSISYNISKAEDLFDYITCVKKYGFNI